MTLDPAIALGITWFFAGMFGLAAWHKLNARREFENAIRGYQLVPEPLLSGIAAGLVGAEILAGALLLIPDTLWVGGMIALALLGLYAAAMSVALLRGHGGISCGCHFGSRSDDLQWWLVLRNLMLMSVIGLLVLPATRTVQMSDLLSGVGAGLCALILVHAAGVARSNHAIIRQTTRGTS